MLYDSLHHFETELASLESESFIDSPDSYDPQLAALMSEEILRRGYKLAITHGITVRCAVLKGSKLQFSVWGVDYEDVVCQAGMRIMATRAD